MVILVDTDDDILHQRKKEQVNEENTGHSFISYFKRATMPLVVLNFLKEQPMYGYEITEAGRACPKKTWNEYWETRCFCSAYPLNEGFIFDVIKSEFNNFFMEKITIIIYNRVKQLEFDEEEQH